MYFYHFYHNDDKIGKISLVEREPRKILQRGAYDEDGGYEVYYFADWDSSVYSRILNKVQKDKNGDLFYACKVQDDKGALVAFRKYFEKEVKELKKQRKRLKAQLKQSKMDRDYFQNVEFGK